MQSKEVQIHSCESHTLSTNSRKKNKTITERTTLNITDSTYSEKSNDLNRTTTTTIHTTNWLAQKNDFTSVRTSWWVSLTGNCLQTNPICSLNSRISSERFGRVCDSRPGLPASLSSPLPVLVTSPSYYQSSSSSTSSSSISSSNKNSWERQLLKPELGLDSGLRFRANSKQLQQPMNFATEELLLNIPICV